MGKISWTREAERWLREIYEFIAPDNPEAAARTVLGIVAKTQALSRFPEQGYRYQERPDKHIRILLFGHYRIAYLVKAQGDIDILGIFHGSLDISRYLA